jgi:predicted acylesterase/phospholipase RssA
MNLDGALLTELLARLAAAAASLALIALLTFALASLAIRLFDLQAFAYRAGLRQFLQGIRATIFLNRGLAPGKRLLFQMTDEEANQILHAGWVEQKDRPGTALNLELRIKTAVQHPDVLADFRGEERKTVEARLIDQTGIIEQRWHRALHLTCAVFALFLAALLQFSALEVVSSSTGRLPFPDSVWGGGIDYFTFGPDRWNHTIGVLLTAALCAIVAARSLRRRFAADALNDVPVAPPVPTLPDSLEPPPIGEPGRPIRAINFSSGGFDTLMHLGVIHSLVVIQGRAPDVVIGLSAGAIHATALPEVLQAGDKAEEKYFEEKGRGWKSLTMDEKHELQRLRVLARVERLRHFIECAQRAPGRLLDAILPDAYQIDAGQPLQPLQQPRLSQRERAERRAFVVTRSGLARLYNDVLNVPLTISTLTKIARRVLGLVATDDIAFGPRRWAVRIVELMRLWILLGANLLSVARLARVVAWAMVRFWRRPVRETTAGGLIFRLRSTRWLRRSSMVAILAILIFGVWIAMSFTLVPLFGFVAVVTLLVFVVRGDAIAKLHLMDGLQGLVMLVVMACAGAVVFALLIALAAGTKSPDEVFGHFSDLPWSETWRYSFWFSVAVILVILMARRLNASNPRTFADRFLSAYGLDDAIFREHGLRSFLAEIFDPDYYARASMNRAVEAALDGRASCASTIDEQRPARTIADFFDPKKRLPRERIHVGIAVANTESGSLEVVRADTAIVEALVAATAATPWLPPVELSRKDSHGCVRKVLYIDGGNVSREPTHALLKLIRERRLRNDEVGELYIYSVSPFPLTPGETGAALSRDEELAEEQGRAPDCQPGRKFHQYLDLVDIVWRAMRLQRFRDAGLERKLTNLFTDAIPAGMNVYPRQSPDSRKPEDVYYRARVKPIELEYDADLNRRLYRGAKGDRRRIIAESIADGCRAAMQVMIAGSIGKTGVPDGEPKDSTHTVALCTAAVEAHLKKSDLSLTHKDGCVPGSNASLGPGLAEICEHCTLKRPVVGSRDAHASATTTNNQEERYARRLRIDNVANLHEDWPHERAALEEVPRPAQKPPETPERTEMNNAWAAFAVMQKEIAKKGGTARPWPANRANSDKPENRDAPCQRPLISLLFSGGVFRGVYQVGVLNALNELELRPDIIAGASIGSVTAAMIAEAFSIEHKVDKGIRIARLAATYLAVDRLILTDRLADFVRSLTLRASETRFSIREADRVFRRYDQPTLRQFDRSVRRVVAGMERLLYLSPYHLNDIVRAFRDTDSQKLTALLNETVQRFLDRMQVGDEALGAEALRDLITNYVIGTEDQASHVRLTIDELRNRSQILFLATATNLSRGRLEVLGSLPIYGNGKAPVLEEALLASSAFPGVFRPRWSWEVIPGADQVNQFIDGGVMDNLPIDSIAAALHRAAVAKMIERVPEGAPHLIVGASLELRAPSYALAFTRKRFRNSWIRRQKRAKQLGYNTKLDTYEHAEKALRDIHELARRTHPKHAEESDLVDIQLVSIKPEWLCGTFAFHPMLGFRRDRQAKSIAHGCATTLLEFARRKADPEDPKFADYLKAWKVNKTNVPRARNWEEAFAGATPAAKEGKCWLREDVPCPFSRKALEEQDCKHQKEQPLGATLIREISKIHVCCSKRETHLRPV